eukprot:2477992-Amphidinium_carterae.1
MITDSSKPAGLFSALVAVTVPDLSQRVIALKLQCLRQPGWQVIRTSVQDGTVQVPHHWNPKLHYTGNTKNT